METKGFAKRSMATVALSVTLVMSGVLGASADPFASSSKSFASNFTLVNLEEFLGQSSKSLEPPMSSSSGYYMVVTIAILSAIN